jgi:hypothetical protein
MIRKGRLRRLVFFALPIPCIPSCFLVIFVPWRLIFCPPLRVNDLPERL